MKKAIFLLLVLFVGIGALYGEVITYYDVDGNKYTAEVEFVSWCTTRLSNKGPNISLEESYFNSNNNTWGPYKEVDTIPTSRYTVDSYMKLLESKGVLMNDEYVFLNVPQGEGKPYFWKDGIYTYYLVKIYRVIKWL